MNNTLMFFIFMILFTTMFLVTKYCKKESLKILLTIIICLSTVYMVVFFIDFNRTATLKEPIFARENDSKRNIIRYIGLGYKIALEKNPETGNISQSQMTILGMFVVGAVANMDKSNSTGTAAYLFDMKTPYIGDNSAISRLLEVLDIRMYGHHTFELKTSEKPYALIINYSKVEGWGNILNNPEITIEKSAILLALIDNAEEIHWVLPDNKKIHKITTEDLIDKYGDIKDYGKSEESLKSLLVKLDYYNTKEDNPIIMNISNLTNEGLTLKIINNTSNDFQYGEPYSLERSEDGKWIKVEQIKDNCAFIMIGYTLKARKTSEEKYDWNTCYGKLPEGKYRITKSFRQITPDSKSEFKFGKNHIISAEFII